MLVYLRKVCRHLVKEPGKTVSYAFLGLLLVVAAEAVVPDLAWVGEDAADGRYSHTSDNCYGCTWGGHVLSEQGYAGGCGRRGTAGSRVQRKPSLRCL